ncbi:MAG TPA: sugar transferase [Vicinamibacterales bacterium]|nr:sugar transferase [Vicinamibacterales bacterium]
MKRLFDLTVSLVGLLVTAPLAAILAVLVKIDSRGPVLYGSERIGRGGRPFRMFKFRTMVLNADQLGGTSTPENDPRLTRMGRWLRATKLDELPQLLNVVRGEMSLVGPRPQVAWAVALYTPEQRTLLHVRPGITDYASIRFRNEAELLKGSADPDLAYLELVAPEKLRLGLQYVSHRTFAEDLRILAATIVSLCGGRPERLLPILQDEGMHQV